MTSASEVVLRAAGLEKRFGRSTIALRDLSLTASIGQITGILGRNGAGKTTLLRILAGVLKPNLGSVRIADFELTKTPHRAQRLIGYLPERVGLPPELRVDEFLAFRRRLLRVSKTDFRRRSQRLLESLELSSVRRALIGTLSRGYQQRVALAGVLLHQPRILLLDEPATGLDPKQIEALRNLMRDIAKTTAILLSSHQLAEVEQLCSHALVIENGRLTISEAVDVMLAQQAPRAVHARLGGSETTIAELVTEVFGDVEHRLITAEDQHELTLAAECADQRIETFVQRCVERQIAVREIRTERAGLSALLADSGQEKAR